MLVEGGLSLSCLDSGPAAERFRGEVRELLAELRRDGGFDVEGL